MSFKKFLDNAVRILKLARKPTKEEFKIVAKVTGIGILIIGAIGFVVMAVKHLIPSL